MHPSRADKLRDYLDRWARVRASASGIEWRGALACNRATNYGYLTSRNRPSRL